MNIVDLRIVTSRAIHPTGGFGSCTGAASLNTRRAFTGHVDQTVNGLTLVFANWSTINAPIDVAESDPVSSIRVRASVECPPGTLAPVYFGTGNSRAVNVEPGGRVIGYASSMQVQPKSRFWVNTQVYAAAASATAWPLCDPGITDIGDGAIVSTGDVDFTMTPSSIPITADLGYGPALVLGRSNCQFPSVMIGGDSIAYGRGDTIPDANGNTGYIARALNMTGYAKIAARGDSMTAFMGDGASGTKAYQRRLALITGIADACVTNMGLNDLNFGHILSLGALQTKALAYWGLLAGAGMRVWACTILPATTGDWSGSAQTPYAWEAIRTGFNDWIRSRSVPLLSGYFETADKAETYRNSGIWLPNYTADGFHPNSSGAAAIAAAIDPKRLM